MYNEYMDTLFNLNNQQPIESNQPIDDQRHVPNCPQVGEILLYRPIRYETVYLVAQKFNTSPQWIMCMNDIAHPQANIAGRELLIPVLFKKPCHRSNNYEAYF